MRPWPGMSWLAAGVLASGLLQLTSACQAGSNGLGDGGSGAGPAIDGSGRAGDGAAPARDGAAPAIDAARPDAARPDAAQRPDAAPPPPDAAPPPVFTEGPYQFLSESGLYSDIASKTLSPEVMEFEPAFTLWSDGAVKTRWVRIPPGTQINTRSMGRWVLPPGGTLWKEFRDPTTGKRLETRIVQHRSDGSYYLAAFIWNADDSEAVFDDSPTTDPADIPDGCATCRNPPCNSYPAGCHVVPPQAQCNNCHGGEPGKALGFSAVQLSHDGPGATLTYLADAGLLSDPPPPGVTYPVPGTPIERAAIGTLHANCGHCHHSTASQQLCYALTDPDNPDNSGPTLGFEARVMPGDLTVQDTELWQSAVDQDLQFWVGAMEGNYTSPLITRRITPGDHTESAVWYRMSVREWGQRAPYDDHQQMPTIGTNQVDQVGLGRVATWIDSLSP